MIIMLNNTFIEYINNLHNLDILAWPDCCTCGNKNFKIQKLLRKKKKNFFENFRYAKIEDVIDVIKCNLCLKLNINKTQKYLKKEKFINLNKATIRKNFKNNRKTIY